MDINEPGVAGAADACLISDGAEWVWAKMDGDCRADPGRGGGPIRASESASGEVESSPELSVEEVCCFWLEDARCTCASWSN